MSWTSRSAPSGVQWDWLLASSSAGPTPTDQAHGRPRVADADVTAAGTIILLLLLGLVIYGVASAGSSMLKRSRIGSVQERYQERLQQGYAPEEDD